MWYSDDGTHDGEGDDDGGSNGDDNVGWVGEGTVGAMLREGYLG